MKLIIKTDYTTNEYNLQSSNEDQAQLQMKLVFLSLGPFFFQRTETLSFAQPANKVIIIYPNILIISPFCKYARKLSLVLFLESKDRKEIENMSFFLYFNTRIEMSRPSNVVLCRQSHPRQKKTCV